MPHQKDNMYNCRANAVTIQRESKGDSLVEQRDVNITKKEVIIAFKGGLHIRY